MAHECVNESCIDADQTKKLAQTSILSLEVLKGRTLQLGLSTGYVTFGQPSLKILEMFLSTSATSSLVVSNSSL